MSFQVDPVPERDLDLYADLTPDEMRIGLKVAGVGVGRVDYLTDTISLDALAGQIFAMPAHQSIPRAEFHSRIHREDWPAVEKEVELLLAPKAPDVIDVTHRILLPDGEVHWVRARKQVWFDNTGPVRRPVRGVFAVTDITKQHRAELQSEYLIGELHHRTKNLMAVVSSLVRQMSRHSRPEDIASKLIDRLGALARNQDAMVKGDGRRIGIHAVLEPQVSALSHVPSGRMTLAGPDILLSDSASQVIAMVTHELLTNATKYGALSGEAGQVDIAWTAEDGQFTFNWSETGGPTVTPPDRTGFGSRILTSYLRAALEAEGKLDYRPEGVRFSFAAPLSSLTR